MDILHLSKDTDCGGYMLIVIDVFSRYAVGVILKDLKSLTVATALRDDILKHGWGRPDEWVFDGASYFGAEVTAGIKAWAALTRVSAPHHAESHGIIEAHNRSYLDILKCFANAIRSRADRAQPESSIQARKRPSSDRPYVQDV